MPRGAARQLDGRAGWNSPPTVGSQPHRVRQRYWAAQPADARNARAGPVEPAQTLAHLASDLAGMDESVDCAPNAPHWARIAPAGGLRIPFDSIYAPSRRR